jgi:hypothetical protein
VFCCSWRMIGDDGVVMMMMMLLMMMMTAWWLMMVMLLLLLPHDHTKYGMKMYEVENTMSGVRPCLSKQNAIWYDAISQCVQVCHSFSFHWIVNYLPASEAERRWRVHTIPYPNPWVEAT